MNVFTRMSKLLFKNKNDVRIQHQQQIIFILKRFEIKAMNLNLNLLFYVRIIKINKFSDKYIEFQVAITKNQKQYKNIKLTFCSIKHDVFYYNKRV